MKKKCYFVCVAIDRKNQVIIEEIESESMVLAIEKFKEIKNLDPNKCCGPYFKKRGCDYRTDNKLVFTNKVQVAIYNGWYVKAHFLSYPANTAFVFFTKKIDDENGKIPPGEVVNLGDLKFI